MGFGFKNIFNLGGAGGGGTPFNGQNGEASPERGIFFRPASTR